MALPNRMSLRPGLWWLTLNLAQIIQCLSWNNIFIYFNFTYPLRCLRVPQGVRVPQVDTTIPGCISVCKMLQPVLKSDTKWQCVDFENGAWLVTIRHAAVFTLQSLCVSTQDSPKVVVQLQYDSHLTKNSRRSVITCVWESFYSVPIRSPELLFIFPFRRAAWLINLNNT
jgi:hypothetical protein